MVGSSEKLMGIVACGLTKKARSIVMSVSPITVTDIELLALGASMTIHSQMSLPFAADSRVAFEISSVGPAVVLVAMVLIVVAAFGLRAIAGRTLRGMGAEAVTTLDRSVGGGT